MDPLCTLSATRLAALIRGRRVSATEVVDAHIRHIQRVNPAINALVADRFAAARAEAREADERVAAAGADVVSLPPLLGVPCSIKESFALRGMPQTSGLVARRGVSPAQDAVTVTRLRQAGAIPLGVTNLSELCMWIESNNRVYGRTGNPYDPRRTCGGSSGGEGALIGAGGTPFGLGADIGGSIRLPAFFNGVFGHKPSGGLVPNSGQHPLPAAGAMRYICTGPLCRRAEDLMPLLRVLAGPDGEDPGCEGAALGDPTTVELRGLPVLCVESNGASAVTPDLRAALARAAEALAARGARVRHAAVSDLRHSLEIWAALLAEAGGPSFAELLGEGRPVRGGRGLLAWALGRSPHTLPALALTLIEELPRLLPGRARRALGLAKEMKALLQTLIGAEGVMLYPPYVSPAPRHLRPLLPPIHWAYTALFNTMELPVTQVPLGLSERRGARGLPLGVQVVGLHGQDHRTIAVALELERALGGWVPPPLARGDVGPA